MFYPNNHTYFDKENSHHCIAMHIQRIKLRNFKRFTDLTIDLSQNAYKLVLLIGTNGSGKSSVFDAFELCASIAKDRSADTEEAPYYEKQGNSCSITIGTTNGLIRKFGSHGDYKGDITDKSFYGRSSLRQVPRLIRTTLGASQFSMERDSDRPRAYVDRDERFENDLEEVTRDILQDVYKSGQEGKAIIEKYITPINEAFERIFGDNEAIVPKLLRIIPPLDGQVAEVMFQKGEAEFHYDLLSSGEKEIFNVLINLLSRREYYQDTVYFLDEIDLHLNTQLQYNLLQEITEHWIPDNCQLWTASHALGFIDYANDHEHAAIIDFNALDFDKPQMLYPQPKHNFDVFEVAISQEFLAKIFEGKTIFFSENTDTPYYNNLRLDNLIFFTARDKADVFHKAKNTNYQGLIDRDYLADEEIALLKKQYPDLFILRYYSIENYLYHPNNLEAYYQSTDQPFDKQHYIKQWVEIKNKHREEIIIELKDARNSYPFFRENENAKLLKDFRSNAKALLPLLQSDDFETFFKILSAKDFGRQIPQRHNLNKNALSQTSWFRQQIAAVLSI